MSSFGQFFTAKTGKSASDFETFADIEQAVKLAEAPDTSSRKGDKLLTLEEINDLLDAVTEMSDAPVSPDTEEGKT
jgi:hypothetical protein